MSFSEIEARTRAFYEWERAGRGWQTYEYRVPLEPIFRPYALEVISAPLASRDDARHPTLLSRFVDLFRSPSQPMAEAASHTVETLLAPPLFERVDEMVEWDVLSSDDVKIDRALCAHWLQNISGARGLLAFEVIGWNGRVHIRFAAEQRDAKRLEGQTNAFFPDVALRPSRIRLDQMFASANPEIIGAVEFGLAREFMLPLNEPEAHLHLLSPLIGAMGHLDTGDVAVFQVLFERVGSQWSEHAMRAITTPDGKPFFSDAPEITKLAMEKCSEPLFAASIRIGVATQSREAAADVLLDAGTALQAFGSPTRNDLTPLSANDIEIVIGDILRRTTHRSGAILSLSDLLHFVELPHASIRPERLVRRSGRTKAAPTSAQGKTFVLGLNEHEDQEHAIGLSTEERLKHCYLIGASGTGKSTLLLHMAVQDLRAGNGFAVLDPHGDLVDDIMARIPDNRVDDVIVFDPSDEDYPIGFNILSAHSEIERTVLASDLVGVFRRFSTSFGDQMETVLGNAILAMLERPDGGTLLDLRRFLLDRGFREEVLRTVADTHLQSYWKHEFPLLKGSPHAPILTRLNAFLRAKLIRNIVAQKGDRFDLRAIMDGRKILLAKLSHGAIGEDNAYLLGSLLVAKIAQAASSRQNIAAAARTPFMLYLDEFHHFITPSIASILSGARKHGLGLTLAHQEMRQIKKRSDEVMSAVLGNAYTRIIFRVGEEDARTLATGLSFFTAADLQNLGTGEAIARIERATFDCNVRTIPVPSVSTDEVERRSDAVRVRSRAQYGTPRETLVVSDEAVVTPAIIETKRTPKAPAQPEAPNVPPPLQREALPGRGGPQHKYLQSLLKRTAEDRGFRATTEKPILSGHGHIDVAMEREGVSIGCEISITTSVEHELGNLSKCLAAGLDYAVLVSSDKKLLASAERQFNIDLDAASRSRVRYLTPEAFAPFLDEINAGLQASSDTVRGYKVRVAFSSRTAEEQEARAKALTEVIAKSLHRVSAPKKKK